MPNRKVKCPHCEQKLPRGEAVRHTNKRYYHKECYETVTMESRHYKELILYICELYGYDRPPGKILKQIENFKENYNYTNKGIELTLKYFHETLDNPPRDGDGIGIVIYYYEEATKQFIHQRHVSEVAKNIEFNKSKTVVKIKPRNNSKKKHMIDMETI